MKERGSCGGRTRGQTELDVLLGGGVGSREVEDCPVRMRAFQAIVRGKVVSEDAHDRFKVPLYIGNESGSGGALGYQVFSFLSDVHVCFLCRKTHFCPPETRMKTI